jgi:endonuclease-3
MIRNCFGGWGIRNNGLILTIMLKRTRSRRQVAVAYEDAPSQEAAAPEPIEAVKETEPGSKRQRSSSTGTVKRQRLTSSTPPPRWREVWDKIVTMRQAQPAPVDTDGCERLAERPEDIPSKHFRFQTLVSLMLSSQTKDGITAAAVRKLQHHCRTRGSSTGAEACLSVPAILAISETELRDLIYGVGFYNRKVEYLKKVAQILHEQYDDDIPDSVEGLCQLPGVGPKMAHLCMQAAWDKTVGIGVDVHVHRIANRLGWVAPATANPEETRQALEGWLPESHWAAINGLLVGFGQTICAASPRCADCLLATDTLCPSVSKRLLRTAPGDRSSSSSSNSNSTGPDQGANSSSGADQSAPVKSEVSASE